MSVLKKWLFIISPNVFLLLLILLLCICEPALLEYYKFILPAVIYLGVLDFLLRRFTRKQRINHPFLWLWGLELGFLGGLPLVVMLGDL